MPSSKKDAKFDALARILQLDPSEFLERRSLEDREVGAFVRAYASSPDTADLDARSTFREDSAISSLTDILSSTKGDLNVVDLCCGIGTLGKRLLLSSRAQCGRINYIAVDRDPVCIDGVRANSDAFSGFKSLRVLQREILDLGGLAASDLIVLNNTLHELPPHRFPDIFAALNGALKPKSGRVSVVDMEELPSDGQESIAITWTADEIEMILKASGFGTIVTKHTKAVGVYRADIRYTEKPIDRLNTLAVLDQLLSAKLLKTIEARRRMRVDLASSPLELMSWIVETGRLARLAEELHLVRMSNPVQSNA